MSLPAFSILPCTADETPNCIKIKLEVRDVLARVGDKWSLYVVGNLYGGPVRFNELKRRIPGVSQRMLTLTLRGLERDGLVTRTVYPTNPPSVDYALTDLGRSLTQPVRALVEWSEAHLDQLQDARDRFDLESGSPPNLEGPAEPQPPTQAALGAQKR